MRNFQIILLLVFTSLFLNAQNIKAEYLYLEQINSQEISLIKDNIPNALTTLDSIIYHFPNTSSYATSFVEKLGNSFLLTKNYESAIFLYLVEACLFPETLNSPSRLKALEQAYTFLEVSKDSQIRLASIPSNTSDFTSPLLIVKHLNSKNLDLIINRYLKIIREKGILIPKELLLWEDLINFNISPDKRADFLITNFENLTKEKKRKYYRKGNHYFNHIHNKSKAKQYLKAYKINISSTSNKICYLFLKIRTTLLF